MKKDYSTELRAFLEEHSKTNDFDMTFECKKEFNSYRIKVTDSYGDSKEKEIDLKVVSDFLRNHNLECKKEILEIIFNPGPRITNSPGR